MTGKIAGEGSIEKKASFTVGLIQVNNSNLTFKCLANLPFSYDFWIVLGLNFQMRVVPTLN